MGTYLSIMVLPVVVGLIFLLIYREPIEASDKLKKKYLIICGILMFLIIGCRHYSVGSGDSEWYYRQWIYMRGIPFEYLFGAIKAFDMEIGYVISIWFLSHIFRDPQFLFICSGLLMAISICRFLYKNSVDSILSMTMYFTLGLWGFMVQGTRQAIAMSICLFAIEFCKERKLIPFLLLVFLAMQFHASAIIFIVVYFFSWLKMNLKSYLLVTGCAVIAIFSLDEIFGLINFLMNEEYGSGVIESSGGGFISALIYLLILMATIFLLQNESVDETKITLFFYMTLCGFILFMMRYSVNTIMQRAAYYFMFAQMALLPSVMKKTQGIIRLFSTTIVIVLCLGIAVYKGTYSDLVPYIFFWQR